MLGVLDLDSPALGRFDQEDADGLHVVVAAFLQGSELSGYAVVTTLIDPATAE